MHAANDKVLETAFNPTLPAAEASGTSATSRPRRHPIDVRLSLPWFGKRYYLRLLSGPESRNPRRLDNEGQTGFAKVSLFYGLVLCIFFASAIFGAAVFLYLVKSLLGINLFEAHSPFHRIFF